MYDVPRRIYSDNKLFEALVIYKLFALLILEI